MKSIVRTVCLAGAACLTVPPVWAADGILLVQKVTVGGGTAMTHQIQIEPHRMRMETGGGAGGGQTIIFDGSSQVMYIVNDGNKTYSEINKADMDALSSQMTAAMAQMPPEARARMEAMMRGRGGAGMGTASKTEYKKTGTGTAGKWTCDKYEGYQNGQKTIDMCTVDPKVLGFGLQDFGVAKDFAEFFQKVMPGNTSQMFTVGNGEAQGYSGVPVQSTVTTNGQTFTSEITDVKKQAFPDSTFQPPAGYAKQPSPFGRGRRGGGQ
jgi:hypothetical protein